MTAAATSTGSKNSKLRWSTALNSMYQMASRNNEDGAEDQDDKGRAKTLSYCIVEPADSKTSNFDCSHSSQLEQDGIKTDKDAACSVLVTCSQQTMCTTTETSSSDSGILRTTSRSQHTSSKTVRVKSTMTSTTTSEYDATTMLPVQMGSTSGVRGLGSFAALSEFGAKTLRPTENAASFEPGSATLVGIPTSGGDVVPMLSDEDRAIEETLNRTLTTFNSLLQKQRERFMEMFPQFVNERTKPEVTTETVVRPDGTVVIIEKQISRRMVQLSQRTRIVNGVVKSTITRAVMVYGGPENGYELKMEDVEESPADSEAEDDDDKASIAPSEYSSDAESRLICLDRGIKDVHESQARPKKKLDKAWFAAQELVDTERRYVAKLKLLEKNFRNGVEKLQDKSITSDKVSKLFSNIGSLLMFHDEHLLPNLESRLREWQETQRISDVLCKLAPYLKMYSEYTNNYKKACKIYDELKKKNKRFSGLVAEIEMLTECDNLPLHSHLICPVQRVARYHLLLQEYQKNLPDNHVDRADAEMALEKVKVAASHANDMMKKLDKYKDVIEVQEMVGNQIQGLVTPTRELIKKGRLTKISGRTGDRQDRTLFLFDDLLLLCSDRAVPLTRYKLRAHFSMDELQLLEGDNLELENTFYIRSKDKTIELQAKTNEEKSDWMETLWSVIQNHKARKDAFKAPLSSTTSSPVDPKDKSNPSSPVQSSPNNATQQKSCYKCKSSFKFLLKEYVCRNCDASVCKKCSRKAPLTPDSKERSILCLTCVENLQKDAEITYDVQTTEARKRRKSMHAVKPSDDCVWKGTLQFRNARSSTWLSRYFALHSDFVLYCFRDENDQEARNSLLVPGCKISLANPKQDSSVSAKEAQSVFKLVHQNVTYYFKSTDENDLISWMAALDLASQAELPNKASPDKNDDQRTDVVKEP